MAIGDFKQKGEIINVTLAADTEYHGLVAIGDSLIGFAKAPGKAGDVVAVDVVGVFEVAKASGSAMSIGDPVTVAVDDTTHVATATATESATSNAVVWEDAASEDTVVRVKINERITVAGD